MTKPAPKPNHQPTSAPIPNRTRPQSYRGEAIGLPPTGRGSLADTGPRIGAFVVDAVLAAVIAGLLVQFGARGGDVTSHFPGTWSLAPLAVDYVFGVLFFGRTVGMNLFGLRLIRVDDDVAIGPGRIVIRTFLLFLLVPAVVFDRDGRGLHDRVTDTAVVRG